MEFKKIEVKKITVVGAGYVGISLAVLLAQKYKVTVYDIDFSRIRLVNSRRSTVKDSLIQKYLEDQSIEIKATANAEEAYRDADIIIIATPSNFYEELNSFDTSAVDSVLKDALSVNVNALIVIKSTIPIGHTKKLQEEYKSKNIIFSPEFLREGFALEDNLHPSRIIVGNESKLSQTFANILKDCSDKEDVELLLMKSSEAESVKLFSNAYLAMRVSFFNELDSFAMANSLDPKKIIDGLSLDNRISSGYNNPSLGYGGYCLPKDTKQLKASFKHTPQKLITSIIDSNEERKNFIVNQILQLNPETVGFYRLTMKKDSDNLRSSAAQSIIKKLRAHDLKVLIYEPLLDTDIFLNSDVVKDISYFKKASDLIVANRLDKNLEEVKHKCFSRDLFGTS